MSIVSCFCCAVPDWVAQCSSSGFTGIEETSASLSVCHCCRTLTRSPGMMLVFRSVTLSLASMANVSIVVGLFFLIFAVMGVQLFGGRFWTCNDTSVANKVCVSTQPVCALSQIGILQMIWTMVSAGQAGCSLLTYSLQVANGIISTWVYRQAAAKESYNKGTAVTCIRVTPCSKHRHLESTQHCVSRE